MTWLGFQYVNFAWDQETPVAELELRHRLPRHSIARR